MATLKSEHKRLIVQRLAAFVDHRDIIDELKGIGVEVTYSQVAFYDPSSKRNEVSQEWRLLHAEFRKAFIEGAADLAISHRNYRMRELQDMARSAKKAKNYKLAAELLEQAAKEMGDAFTNRRELYGKGGVPLVPPAPNTVQHNVSGEIVHRIGIYLPDNGRVPSNEVQPALPAHPLADEPDTEDLPTDFDSDTEEELTELPHEVDGADPWEGLE